MRMKTLFHGLTFFSNDSELGLNVTREMLISAQKDNPALSVSFASVIAAKKDSKSCAYYLDNDVLMRHWSPDSTNLCLVNQVVVPKEYCVQILSLAHESGHLGVKNL